MRCRIFEVRMGDEVYSVMAIELADSVSEMRVWLLARCGFPPEAPKRYLITILDTMDSFVRAEDWPEVWQQNLHSYVIDQFDHIYDGKVLDIDHLSAERDKPRQSSRAT